jgi:hypothetical protein
MVTGTENHFESTRSHIDPESLLKIAQKIGSTILEWRKADAHRIQAQQLGDTRTAERLRHNCDVTEAYIGGMYEVLDKLVPLDSGREWDDSVLIFILDDPDIEKTV